MRTDLLERITLGAKDPRDPLGHREGIERPFERSCHHPLLQGLFVFRGVLEFRGVALEAQNSSPLAATQPPSGFPNRDGGQPALEGSDVTEATQMAMHDEEDVLNDVIDFVGFSENRDRHASDIGAVGTKEDMEILRRSRGIPRGYHREVKGRCTPFQPVAP